MSVTRVSNTVSTGPDAGGGAATTAVEVAVAEWLEPSPWGRFRQVFGAQEPVGLVSDEELLGRLADAEALMTQLMGQVARRLDTAQRSARFTRLAAVVGEGRVQAWTATKLAEQLAELGWSRRSGWSASRRPPWRGWWSGRAPWGRCPRGCDG